MFYHLILGLLRDGRPRHGYELAQEYRSLGGQTINIGNLYRECSKLVSQHLIMPDPQPQLVDRRRIPYRITEKGCLDFDSWLLGDRLVPAADLGNWVMFADMLAPSDRERLVEQMREQLWIESKSLATARDRVTARRRRVTGPDGSYDPASLLTFRRIRQLSAELEFLDKLRGELVGAPRSCLIVSSEGTSPDGKSDVMDSSAILTRRSRRVPQA